METTKEWRKPLLKKSDICKETAKGGFNSDGIGKDAHSPNS